MKTRLNRTRIDNFIARCHRIKANTENKVTIEILDEAESIVNYLLSFVEKDNDKKEG